MQNEIHTTKYLVDPIHSSLDTRRRGLHAVQLVLRGNTGVSFQQTSLRSLTMHVRVCQGGPLLPHQPGFYPSPFHQSDGQVSNKIKMLKQHLFL